MLSVLCVYIIFNFEREIDMKIKLLTICFAAAINIFNVNIADAMRVSAKMVEQKDRVADYSAIIAVKRLEEFVSLPADRVERLNPAFVADAKVAHTKLTSLSEIQTLADFSELDTSWLQPSLVQAIKRADIKLNFNLPASLYGNIENMPEDNTIGTQFMAIMNGNGAQPTLNDDVSKAFEILYTTVYTNAHITSATVAQVDTIDHYWEFSDAIFPSLGDYTTENYLKFLSGILVAGRKAENDFSNIKTEVMPEFLYSLRHMIGYATDEDLGI